MEYKIVDFPLCQNPKEGLKTIINRETTGGFEYAGHQYSDKLVPGTSGCFGIGAKAAYTMHVGLVVFKK